MWYDIPEKILFEWYDEAINEKIRINLKNFYLMNRKECQKKTQKSNQRTSNGESSQTTSINGEKRSLKKNDISLMRIDLMKFIYVQRK